MAASRTGSASQVDASAASGSTSVTVPADATAAVAFWSHFNNLGVSFLDTLELAGLPFLTRSEIATKQPAADNTGVGVATLASLPSPGSQTLAWAWSDLDARDEGGGLFVVWVNGVDLADLVRDADTATQSGGSSLNFSIDSSPTDLILALAQSFFSDSDPTGPATVFLNNAHVNQEGYDLSDVTPDGGATTAIACGAGSYPTLAAISLKAAAAGAPASPTYHRSGLMAVS
jgi:hypothetical protein